MDTVSSHVGSKPSLVRAGTIEDLRQRGFLTVSSGRHGIVVFWHEGTPYAVDNRCPHMGFPAQPWHHPRRRPHLSLAPRPL